MTRKLRPCGTQSAYRRHLNRGEEPCAACRAANTARTNPGSPSALRVGEQEWALEMEANPAVIVWAKDSHGISHAVYIDDPHAEKEPGPRHRADPVAGFIAALTAEQANARTQI